MTAGLRQSLQRCFAFFRREELDRELDAEMASHLELAVEENLRVGMSAEEARRQALIRFGGTQQSKELHRDTRGIPWLDVFLQDLRYTFRTLRKERAFACVAILILALGIGANITVFSLVSTILLRPLPFYESKGLVWIDGHTSDGSEAIPGYTVSVYEEFRRHNQSFQEVTAFMPFWGSSEYNLTGRGEAQHVQGVIVAENFFQTLGVHTVLGRTFLPSECTKGGPPAVILTYAFWREQFGADPLIVGQEIRLSKRPVTVVGVLPATFDFASVFWPGLKADVFVPGVMDDMRGWGDTLWLFGRLKPGVTVSQAQAESIILFPQLRAANPDWSEDYMGTVMPLQDYVSGKLRRSLMVLWGAVGLILLIVCVNLSNLLLARIASRSKEFATRSALGASRGRLIRQLLTESLLLSSAGALLGVALAFVATRYLAHQGSILLPLLGSVGVDSTAIAWTLLITLVASVLFGLGPGLILSRGNVQEAFNNAARGSSEGKKHDRLRSTMVVSEVALACVLLVGAGLLLRSFLRVLDVDLGFQPSHAAVLTIIYDEGDKGEKRGPALQEIVYQVRQLPGIEAAGVADMLPLDRNRSWGLYPVGHVYKKGEDLSIIVRIVTPDYLRAIGIHLIEGRDFAWEDTAKSEPVVIINEAAAQQLWPGANPLGRLASLNGGKNCRVVGIVSNVLVNGLEGAPGKEMYLPMSQAEPEGAELVVRSKLPPEVLTRAVLGTLRRLNPAQPATVFRPIQTLVEHSVSPRRFFVSLVAIFAGLGLLLAALGIYGVISYSVTRQTREFGIRMALGASRGRIQNAVLTKTMSLALGGIAIGGIASFAASQLLASLLFKTEPTDPIIFVGVLAILAAVAAIAGYLPARRATRVDPMIALRYE